MKYRTLGRIGIEVSEVAFGGVEIGMPYANQKMPSESEAIRLLHEAVDQGVNFFDTARSYGRSELIMGKAFGQRRSQVVICTKVANLLTDQGRLLKDEKLEEVIDQSLSTSLEALQTDYVDVFMLHQVSDALLQSGVVMDKFSSLKKSGKIRSTGISTYSLAETKLVVQQGFWDVIQLPYHLLNQEHAILFNQIRSANLGLIVRSVLFRGLLGQQVQPLHPALTDVEELLRNLRHWAENVGLDLPSLAINFALSSDAVSSALVGIDTLAYLHQAVKVSGSKRLTTELLKELKSMAYPDPSFLNLHQWDKNGWLK